MAYTEEGMAEFFEAKKLKMDQEKIILDARMVRAQNALDVWERDRRSAEENEVLAQELIVEYTEVRKKWRETMDHSLLDDAGEIEGRLKKALLGWRKF